MLIPLDELSQEAVQGLIDEYCTREQGGTDPEEPLSAFRDRVEQALYKGRLVVMYTPHNPNQVATLVPAEQLDEKER